MVVSKNTHKQCKFIQLHIGKAVVFQVSTPSGWQIVGAASLQMHNVYIDMLAEIATHTKEPMNACHIWNRMNSAFQ